MLSRVPIRTSDSLLDVPNNTKRLSHEEHSWLVRADKSFLRYDETVEKSLFLNEDEAPLERRYYVSVVFHLGNSNCGQPSCDKLRFDIICTESSLRDGG